MDTLYFLYTYTFISSKMYQDLKMFTTLQTKFSFFHVINMVLFQLGEPFELKSNYIHEFQISWFQIEYSTIGPQVPTMLANLLASKSLQGKNLHISPAVF
jgi:hypothetical protein